VAAALDEADGGGVGRARGTCGSHTVQGPRLTFALKLALHLTCAGSCACPLGMA
jgi:hypothetical protein